VSARERDPWQREIKVAGVTFEHRQEVLERMTAGEWLRGVREPDNEYDSGAVALWRVDERGVAAEQVGYIPRAEAPMVARLMDAEGYEVWGFVDEVTGGSDGLSFGLKVTLKRRLAHG
jgi:single-stranded-DNA-specific exonuclease